MRTQMDSVYEFVFRGLLTEEALDGAGRKARNDHSESDSDVAATLSVDLLDDDLVAEAKRMAAVYTAVAAFENTVRDLVRETLTEEFEEKWWADGVSDKIRQRAESRRDEEQKNRWHTPRGAEPINYTELGDLVNTIRRNEDLLTPFIPSADWAKSVFDVIERSRNVIMHSGTLSKPDIERLGINIRDWIKQVGT
ncbi:Swt1 family HEPN domain-containing protein [bacterium]|nr:Swt1 family HEPN domain-containing protein [bacterium]